MDPQGEPNYPNKTQAKVLDWVDRVRAGKHPRKGIPIVYLQGGVGSGKTRALLAPAIECLMQIKDLRMLWGRQDFNDLRLSAMETFFEVMPQEVIAKRNVQEHRYQIDQGYGNFSQIFFRELKDLAGLGSQEFGIIIVTEVHEITEQAFKTLKMRCRQAHVPTMILMEGNPPNEEHWLSQLTDSKNDSFDPDIEMWQVSTYENWRNLPDSYTHSLEQMPQSWKNKYLFGHFGFMPDGKPFYDGFNEIIHVGEYEWNPYKELIVGIDFGFHHPACLITQIDDHDRWVILEEMLGTDITVDKFADKITANLQHHYPNCTNVLYFGDPACTQVNDKSEFTSWQIMASKNIMVKHKVSEYRLRKEIIEKKLATLIKAKPTLLVDHRCHTVIDGFLGGYHYPTRKEGQQFNIKMEQPFRDGYYEHLMNAMEYIAVNLFSPLTVRRPMPRRRIGGRRVDNI